MAVFYDAVGTGDQFYSPAITLVPFNMAWKHNASGGQIAVVTALSYWVGLTSLSTLTRQVTYGGIPMTSLGVVQWTGMSSLFPTETAWTELFGLLNAPAGQANVRATIRGGVALTRRFGRANSVSYSGVSSFGSFTSATGTNTSLSVSSTAAVASVSVAAFGSKDSGISNFSRNTRYQTNVNMSLAIGDVDGNGSSQSFTSTLGASAPWGAGAVSLQAADIVATAQPILVDADTDSAGKRYPRSPSFIRRSVFSVRPER